MLRLALIIIIATLGAIGAIIAINAPGRMTLEVGEQIYSFNLAIAGILLLLLLAGLVVLWSGASGLFTLPKRIRSKAKQRQKARAEEALISGILAAEGGDGKEAERHFSKTGDRSDSELGLLLRAKSAEAREDWDKAELAYAALANEKNGALAARRGLVELAAQKGDLAAAERHAQEALNTKSNAAWPYRSLFQLQVSQGHWENALKTLSTGEQTGFEKSDIAKRKRAVLLTAKASMMNENDITAAEKAANDASKAAPGFIPAHYWRAKLLARQNKVSKALSHLEQAWVAASHVTLAELYLQLCEVSTAEARANAMIKLSQKAPDAKESAVLRIEAALMKNELKEAQSQLDTLFSEEATRRLHELQAVIYRQKGEDKLAFETDQRALSAPTDSGWASLDDKGQAFDYSSEEWSNLVYSFGESGNFIPPVSGQGQIGYALSEQLVLPAPELASSEDIKDETDEAAGEADPGEVPQKTPPAPDYAPQ